MTLNEVLTKQNFLTKLILKDNDGEVSKNLKIKIMKARIEYSKIRKQFDSDLQEFVNELSTDRFKELSAKQDKNEEERKELDEIIAKINDDYNTYVSMKGKDQVVVNDLILTEDEFNELLERNIDNDIEVNGTKINAADFIEILHTLFVK